MGKYSAERELEEAVSTKSQGENGLDGGREGEEGTPSLPDQF